MEKSKKVSVTHLWTDYHIHISADFDPHSYLKSKGFPSNIFAGAVITDRPVPKDIKALITKTLKQHAENSFLSRVKRRLFKYFFWKKVNKWVSKQIVLHDSNVLHIHFGYTAVNMLDVIKNSGLPVIVTFYGVDGSTMFADPEWVALYKQAFKYVDHFVVLAQIVKDRIVELGIDPNKITLWNIPIKLDTYAYRAKKRTQVIRFIIAARFVEKKGYPYLLDAFKTVNTKYPNTTLTIIGYGSARNKVEDMVTGLGLEAGVNIIDTASVENFHDFYYSQLLEHDIFVLPSTTSKDGDDEGGPALTLVCAQAAGLPVICTPFVGAEITVFDGVTGLLCKQDDATSIADKMIYLINNQDIADKLGKSASELVHPLFAEEPQMEKILDIYTTLI